MQRVLTTWTLSAAAAAGVLAAACAPLARAAVVGQVDTFQSLTTEGWFAGGAQGQQPPTPPHVMPDGGPNGAGDAFLVVTSEGGNGPGSRMSVINGTQWAGDYLSAGIGVIAMDVNNLGTSDLTLRLVFENPVAGPPTDLAVSTVGLTLAAGSGWTHVEFPIAPSDLTAVDGTAENALATATFIRIIHSTDPTFPPDPIAGQLGVDNITAVPEPAALGGALAAGGLMLARRRRRVAE